MQLILEKNAIQIQFNRFQMIASENNSPKSFARPESVSTVHWFD